MSDVEKFDFLAQRIRGLPLSKHALCSKCRHETSLPILWTDWWCERCGHHCTIDDSNTAEGLVRLSLQWAGVDYESIGLAIGHPRDIPLDVRTKLAQELGREPKFLGLNRKFRWQCINCGKCCHLAIAKATGHLATLGDEEAKLLGVEQDRLPVSKVTGACKFWEPTAGGDQQGTCAVHAIRPSFCRTFPLGLFGLNDGKRHIRFVLWTRSACPGLGQGKVWTVRDLLKQSGVLHQLIPQRGIGHESEE